MEKIQQLYRTRNNGTFDNKGTEKQDSLKISDKALKIRELQQKMAELPEVREERINHLKDVISKGEYQVDSQAIAFKIMTGLK